MVKVVLNSFLFLALALYTTTAGAAPPSCDVACSCAMPCSMVCTVYGTNESTTCEASGQSCIESCPDEHLEAWSVDYSSLTSDDEMVCR